MNRALEVMTVEGVRGYVDSNNVAWLNAEDVAHGLEFTQEKNGVEYVRWERVNQYLADFGFPQKVGKDDYIPENMFYRLVWKSRDEKALEFQAKVADEILPAIRKNGVYATGDFLQMSIANPAWAIGVLTELQRRQEETALLKVQLAEAKPKVEYCDIILQCKELVTTSVIAKDYGYSAKSFNKLLHELGVQFRQGNIWLLYQKYARLGWTQTKTHSYKDADGCEHCKVHMYWTQKGRIELYLLLKDHGILPSIEQEAA